MSKKTLNPTVTAGSAFEDFYARIEDPTVYTFPKSIVLLGVMLSTHSSSSGDRVKQLTAAMILGLPEEERIALLNEYAIPSDVSDMIEDGAPWPESLSTMEYTVLDGTDLSAYKARKIVQLRNHIETQVAQIIVGGHRMVLTQISSVIEAVRVLNGLYTTETAEGAEFPHLVTILFRDGLSSIEEAAAVTLATNTAWSTANAALEGLRNSSTLTIDAAEEAGEVDQIFVATKEQVDAVVSALSTA